MSKLVLIILILLLCAVSCGIAQDTPAAALQHLLCLSSGVSSHRVRDDIISPLLYKGSQIPLHLTYEYRGTVSRHTITAFYDRLDLSSSITDMARSSHYAKNTNLSLDYSYARRITAFDLYKTECFLGARAGGFLNWRDFYYSYLRSDVSLEAMASLALDVRLETTFDNASGDCLTVHAGLPLLSYVVLDDRYNTMVSETFRELDPDRNAVWHILTNGDIVTLNTLFQVQSDISYTKFFGASLGLRLQYGFLYYSFAQNDHQSHARCVNHRFLAGIIILL